MGVDTCLAEYIKGPANVQACVRGVRAGGIEAMYADGSMGPMEDEISDFVTTAKAIEAGQDADSYPTLLMFAPSPECPDNSQCAVAYLGQLPARFDHRSDVVFVS